MSAGGDDGQTSPASLSLIKALSLTYLATFVSPADYDTFFGSPEGFFHIIEPCQLVGCAVLLQGQQLNSLPHKSASEFIRFLIDLNGPHVPLMLPGV